MKRQHLPLIIGIALPIVFIIIISIVIYTPNLGVHPEHNFVYTNENSYPYDSRYKNSYTVKNNRIVEVSNNLPTSTYPGGYLPVIKDVPDLYLYDVKNNTSHQISFEEAQNYVVDAGPSSPDGYTVQYEGGYGSIFDLFGDSRGDMGYYIEKDRGKKRLVGMQTNDRYSYQYNFKLLGWVK